MRTNEPITVYISDNQTDHLLAQSVLEGEKIKFFTKNENVQNLFGMGQFGTGYNPVTGPMEIQVLQGDYEQAQLVIKEFFGDKRSKAGLSYSDTTEEREQKLIKEYNFCLNAAIIIGLVLPPLNLYHLSKALLIKSNSGLQLKGGFKIILAATLSLFGFVLLSGLVL
jgi:uncharacterized protein YutD